MLQRRTPRPVIELVGVRWPVLPLVLCEWKPQEHGAFRAPGGCWAQLTMCHFVSPSGMVPGEERNFSAVQVTTSTSSWCWSCC